MPNVMAYRVIVIDDDPDIAEDVCDTLEIAGIACVYAASAVQACEIVAAAPDVGPVIVDYHMPGMNGLELIQLLRSRTQRPLAFIMLTGDETQAVAAGAVRAQAFDFLGKPVQRDDLLDAVRRAAGHLDALSKAEVNQKSLEKEAEALRQRVDTISQMLQQREKLLQGVLAPDVPALAQLKRSHACATVDFLDQLALIEDGKAPLSSRQTITDRYGQAAALRPAAADDGGVQDTLDCTPIEMGHLLKRMIPAMKQLADRKRITIRTAIPGNLPFLYGDAHRLMRAMQDLLTCFIGEIDRGDHMGLVLMKQEAELIVTLRLRSAKLAEAFFDVFRGELPSIIDTLTELPATQAKLLAARIVIQLHAGRIALEPVRDAEWCLRVVLPVPSEDGRASSMIA